MIYLALFNLSLGALNFYLDNPIAGCCGLFGFLIGLRGARLI